MKIYRYTYKFTAASINASVKYRSISPIISKCTGALLEYTSAPVYFTNTSAKIQVHRYF